MIFPPNALRDSLRHVYDHGFGDNVDVDACIESAARGLLSIYDDMGLVGESDFSAADQCEALYDLLNRVGMAVA